MTCHRATMIQSQAICVVRQARLEISKSQSMHCNNWTQRGMAHMNGVHHAKVDNHTVTSFWICAVVHRCSPHMKSAMDTCGPMHPTRPLWPRRYCRRRTWWEHLKKPCSSKQNPACVPIHAHRNLPVQIVWISAPQGPSPRQGILLKLILRFVRDAGPVPHCAPLAQSPTKPIRQTQHCAAFRP